jgi:hypothetical protein
MPVRCHRTLVFFPGPCRNHRSCEIFYVITCSTKSMAVILAIRWNKGLLGPAIYLSAHCTSNNQKFSMRAPDLRSSKSHMFEWKQIENFNSDIFHIDAMPLLVLICIWLPFRHELVPHKTKSTVPFSQVICYYDAIYQMECNTGQYPIES